MKSVAPKSGKSLTNSSRGPSSSKRGNLGERMVAFIKRCKDHEATTEQLAKAAGVSVSEAFSRLWWMAEKDGLLRSTGHGKERSWRLSAKGTAKFYPAKAS